MIRRVTVREFRGISGTEVFEPETLTILTGRNGLGKTTFFDAVDWCLFGEASRLGSQSGLVKNLYHSESHPSVEVVLTLGREDVAVRRTEDGVTLNKKSVSEHELAEALIIDPEVFPPHLRQLGRRVRTVTYLPQEQIREFVTASLSSERKALLQGLLGVPNAGIVESSIKRISDHFSMRARNLIEETNKLDYELRQFPTALDFDLSVDQEARSFLAAFREGYGDRSGSMDSLRSAMEAEIATLENNAAMLDNTLAAHGETVATVAQADKEIATLQQRRATLLNLVAEIDSKVREGSASIDTAIVAQQDAAREAIAAEARLASLVDAISKKQRFEELSKELAKWDRERADVASRSTALKLSAESLQLELEVTEKVADEYRLHVKLTQERVEFETRRADIQKRLSALQDERARREDDLAGIERDQAATSRDLADALTAMAQASASHELAMQSSRRAAQLADLRNRLISLIEPAESHCPLCGADYGTYDRLSEHLLRSAATSEIDERLRGASSAVDAADTKLSQLTAREKLQSAAAEKHRIALEQLEREVLQLKTQHESLTLSLRELGEPPDMRPSSDALAKVTELRTQVVAADRSLSQLDDDLRSIEIRRNKVASELEELELSGALTVAPEVTTETIAEARQRVSQTHNRVDDHEQKLRMLRDTQATLESRMSDTRSQIAASEGRLNAERERKRRVLENFDRQCASLGLVDLDAERIGGELQQRAERLRSGIFEIRHSIGQAKAIERRQIINESMIKQRDLQKRLAQIQENLSELRRAQNRFDRIAEELRSRSKTEAGSAGALYLAAAQECVNDLYPHRHLNEVDIDFTEGELLVKDRWLSKGVRPQDYSSTGQANVLALSVFLGLALRQTFSASRFLLLDEPVQNLDDLHFLAFLTLLKRVALSRQVIISIADSNVAGIMRRQLRSWSLSNHRWCEYEWVAFQPESGPLIRRHEWPGPGYRQRLTGGPEMSFEEIVPR